MKVKIRFSIILVLMAIQGIQGQQQDNQRVTTEEARRLVTTALRTNGANKLPGFALEETKGAGSTFYFFEATWDNPQGSVVIGHYAVDLRTGDVWNAIVCEELRSPSLKALQQRVRKRLGLTESEYQKIRRPGPMC